MQKNQYNNQNQNSRFNKRVDDRFNRLLDELRRIVDDGVLQVWGKGLGKILHRVPHCVRSLYCVRARKLKNGQRHRRLTVQIGITIVILCSATAPPTSSKLTIL